MANESTRIVVGIDVGTSGVRAVAASPDGDVLATSEYPLVSLPRAGRGVHEQNPEDWWTAVCQVTQALIKDRNGSGARTELAGTAITSTSGTLVLADRNGRPVRSAILYDDTRSSEIARTINAAIPQTVARVNSSYSLVKAAWVRQHEPRIWDRVRYILHPAGWLAGRLAGEFGVSDGANLLKLGYDAESGGWIEAAHIADLPRERLPRVVRCGQQIGTVTPWASASTGLQSGTAVVAGATDGIASMIASGAWRPGDANTTLGTTIIWKVLARNKPAPASGMYCHLHPSGLWVPGAASNTGPGSLQSAEPKLERMELDRRAAHALPTPVVCYLCRDRGERYPFLNDQATTFVEGTPRGVDEWYAAQLQSLAFVERWGYEALERSDVELGEVVYSTGGAAHSPVLSQLRSSVLGRAVLRCQHPTSAFGSAILAASGMIYSEDLPRAIENMTRVQEICEPQREFAERYEEIYARFREACAQRGYI